MGRHRVFLVSPITLGILKTLILLVQAVTEVAIVSIHTNVNILPNTVVIVVGTETNAANTITKHYQPQNT
jgi:hypothetical protein